MTSDSISSSPIPEPAISSDIEPFVYRSQFQDCMEMNATVPTVSAYLKRHQAWFRRCAHPMQVETIDTNAYALVIGHFGALGYEVDPKIALHLLPQDEATFQISTLPLAETKNTDYTVDFQAVMHLVEGAGQPITQVEWELDLTVTVKFPRFIYRLPSNMIQGTGDRLLKQIVRQVSRRLTYKVQQDFHTSYNLPLPTISRKQASQED